MVRVLDLYSGMGGLSLGFALALRNAEILGLDIDKDAVATYNLNLRRFNARAKIQDVLKWEPQGAFDVVMGGVPCQPYSIANTKLRGTEHPLYPTLPRFFDIILALKPKVFLMENVKGLVSRRYRHLLEQQLARVRDYYTTNYRVLNAAHYGVPQRRERLFVIGVRRDLGVHPSFPAPTHAEREQETFSGRLFRWVTVREAISDLLEVPVVVRLSHQGGTRVATVSDEPAFTVGAFTGGGRSRTTMYTLAKQENMESHHSQTRKREAMILPVTEHIMTTKGGWDNPRSDWGSRVMPSDEPAYTITEKHRSGQLVEAIVGFRRLTVRECLRLQSFPDWWGFPDDVSISKMYKLTGEAVPPILAWWLAITIAEILGLETRVPPSRDEWGLPYFDRAFASFFS